MLDSTNVSDETARVVGPRLPLAGDGLLDDALLDEMVARVRADGARLTGPGGFLSEMVKAVLDRGLQAELTEHLGYDAGDPAGNLSGNSRNGSSRKTVQTEIGPV